MSNKCCVCGKEVECGSPSYVVETRDGNRNYCSGKCYSTEYIRGFCHHCDDNTDISIAENRCVECGEIVFVSDWDKSIKHARVAV